jgi:hypothetical protein
MNSRRFVIQAFALAFLVCSVAAAASAQIISRPTAPPLVTAESESWYLSGEPITYSGNTYYPSGAHVHFNGNEMVRSGFFLGVPLYTRTTQEPFSIVYVPLAGGMMQPYERRRSGELAGTAGSTAPTLPTAATPGDTFTGVPQAAGAPTGLGTTGEPVPVAITGTAPAERVTPTVPAAPAPVGTAGRSAASHTRIGPRPRGINAVFVEYRDRRWFAAGAPIPLDAATMLQVGEHRGFPVFVDRAAPESRIYIPVTRGGAMVLPYTRSRRP